MNPESKFTGGGEPVDQNLFKTMSIRRIFGLLATLIFLGAIWGKRHSLEALFVHANPPPKQIQFDNGLGAAVIRSCSMRQSNGLLRMAESNYVAVFMSDSFTRIIARQNVVH